VTARILVIDDEKLIVWSLQKELEKEGYEVYGVQTAKDGMSLLEDLRPDLVFLDIRLPDKSGLELLKEIKEKDKDILVIMVTAFGGVESAVYAIKAGAYDYIEKPFDFEAVKLTTRRALETARLKTEVQQLRKKEKGIYTFENIVTCSPKMQEVLSLASKFAVADSSTVLIQGESGTGKDLLAKVIHYESSRKSGPFIEINCSSLPETLIESELFGYEKGAFTDAKQAKKGLFEIADGGTVYMDEIGDVPPAIQVKLLRVMEEKSFKHIGGSKSIHVDVRIIAATNRDLEKEVKEGNFREDLYYRLKVLPLYVPPLRERKEDILPLTEYFVSQLNRELRKNINYVSQDVKDLMLLYHWPGNVRELKNVVERMMILAESDTLLPELLPEEIRKPKKEEVSEGMRRFYVTVPEEGISLEEVERELIRQALLTARGNQSKAARLLKISRDTLRYRIQKLGL